jgi:hypothetical protein
MSNYTDLHLSDYPAKLRLTTKERRKTHGT